MNRVHNPVLGGACRRELFTVIRLKSFRLYVTSIAAKPEGRRDLNMAKHKDLIIESTDLFVLFDVTNLLA